MLKCKFHGIWAKLERKTCFLRQLLTKYCRQIMKLSKIGFLWDDLHLIFCNFVAQLSKFAFCPSILSISKISLKFPNLLRTYNPGENI